MALLVVSSLPALASARPTRAGEPRDPVVVTRDHVVAIASGGVDLSQASLLPTLPALRPWSPPAMDPPASPFSYLQGDDDDAPVSPGDGVTVPAPGGAWPVAPTAPGTEPGAANLPPGSDAPLSAGFLALGDDNTVIPPDTNGAVGPNQTLTTLNSQVRVHTRAGSVVSTTSLATFWSSVSASPFDPRALYDPYAGRFLVAAADGAASAGSGVLVGASTTSDPTTFRMYRFTADATGAAWADFPTLGFTKDWITISVNMFSVGGNAYQGTKTWAIVKSGVLAGTGATATAFTLGLTSCSGGSCGNTISPAATYDSTLATQHLIGTWNGGARVIRLWSIAGTVTSPTLTMGSLASGTVAWSEAPSGSNFVPQNGTATLVDAGSARPGNVVFRNGALWMAHTIFLPAATPTRSSVQWWQIQPNGTVTQRGIVDDPAAVNFTFTPSIAVNSANDVLIGYSRSNASSYVGAYYAYRAAGEATGILHADALLKAGEAPYQKTFGGARVRWGDYSATVVDPANDLDMWTLQEYAGAAVAGTDRWSTWWGQTMFRPSATLAPTSLAFGSVRVNVTSASQSVTFTNTGNEPISVGTATIAGAHASDFVRATDGCSNTLVPEGSTCTIQIAFRPTGIGARSATLTLSSTAPGSPLSTSLAGTGLSGALSASPTSLTFPSTFVNESAVALSVTFTNTGNAALAFGSLTSSAEFPIVTDACSAATLSPASSCVVQVSFAPSAAGTRAGQLSVPSDGLASPLVVPLGGTAAYRAPAWTLAPTSIGFGEQRNGTTSAPQTVTLTSVGTTTLRVGTITLAGANASQFAPTDACSGRVLAPGESCTVDVAFSPSGTGARAATLQLPTNATTGTPSVALSGTATEPRAGSSPQTVSFSAQRVGTTSATRSVLVTSVGVGSLNVAGLALVGTDAGSYQIASDACSGTAVPSGSWCVVEVAFAPTHTGALGATLRVTHDGVGGTTNVTLSGTGTQPEATLDASALDFQYQAVGRVSASQRVTLTNTGTATMAIASVTLGGANPLDYAIASSTCGSGAVTLAPGASCAVDVTFKPRAPGVRAAVLALATDAPGSPATVALTGTGDRDAPTSTLDAADPSVLVPALGQRITGDAHDDLSGVAGVRVALTPVQGGAATFYDAVVTCADASRLSCTWTVDPTVVGAFVVHVGATDRAGNAQTGGPTARVVIV